MSWSDLKQTGCSCEHCVTEAIWWDRWLFLATAWLLQDSFSYSFYFHIRRASSPTSRVEGPK